MGFCAMSQSQHKTISEGGRNDGSTESSRLPISQQAMGTIRTRAQIPSAGKGGAMLKFQDKLIFGWVLVTIGLMAFAPETSQSQGGRVKNSTKPTVSSISPTSATAGGASFTLTVVGTNFVSGALVQWVGSTTGSISTTLVSSSQLQAMIPSTLLTAAGTVLVSVYDPGKGGGTSNSATFTINTVPSTTTPLAIATTSLSAGTSDTSYS